MYSASQSEIGQHDDRVWVEVGAKLLSCHIEGECCLFEMGILGFYFKEPNTTLECVGIRVFH